MFTYPIYSPSNIYDSLWDGLQAWWSFDETGGESPSVHIDSHRGFNTTDQVNTPGQTGLVNLAAEVNGVGVVQTLDRSTRWSANDDMAFAAWVRLNTLAGTQTVAGSIDSADADGWMIQVTSDGALKVFMSDGGANKSAISSAGLTYLSVDTWHLVTCNFDLSEGTFTGYVDGVEAVQLTGIVSPDVQDLPLYMFQYGLSNSQNLDGRIDEAAFWKGRTLSSSDIALLYNEGRGISYDDLPAKAYADDLLFELVSWWKFDEASSGTRADSHGGNDLIDLTTTASTSGKIGNALSLSSDQLYVPVEGTELSGTGSFSSVGWFYLNTLPSTAANFIINRNRYNASSTGNLDWFLSVLDAANDNEFYFGMYLDDSTIATIRIPAPAASTWNFYYIYYDQSAQEMGVSLNNGTVTTQTIPTGKWLRAIGNDVVIGNLSTGFSRYFNGLIDEIGYWRRPLTATEVAALYNSGTGISYEQL